MGIGTALAVCVMSQASAFSRRMACEIQNSVSEDRTGICVFLPWPIDSEWIIKTNLSRLLPEAFSHALPDHPAFPPPTKAQEEAEKVWIASNYYLSWTFSLYNYAYGPFRLSSMYMPCVH